MHRFFVKKIAASGRVVISGPEAHHMLSVLRLGVGDRVILFDGTDSEYLARIRGRSGSSAEVEIIQRRFQSRELPVDLSIAQGIIKGKKMDLVVQKSAELGATLFVPVTFRRSVARISGKEESKRTKWQRLAAEASKQCGRNRVMKVLPPVKFEDLLKTVSSYDLKILAIPGDFPTLKGLLHSRQRPRSILVVVGPEGGLAPEELLEAKLAGLSPATLGRATLRAETASIAILAMIAYEYAL